MDDIDQTIRAVEANGGKIAMAKFHIPTVGHGMYFTDTEGNRVGYGGSAQVGGQRERERGYGREVHFVQQHSQQAGVIRNARIERGQIDYPQNQFAEQRRHRKHPAFLVLESRRIQTGGEIQGPHGHAAPHAHPVRAAGRNEDRLAGRDHPRTPGGLHRHGAGGCVEQLMPLVSMFRQDESARKAVIHRTHHQEGFLLDGQADFGQPLARLRHSLSIYRKQRAGIVK